jgi:tetrathionate reductase subunit B
MTYALIIDEALCWGCKTCEVACKQENGAPDGVKLISVREDGPNLVNNKEPPCADACPVGAISKRQDGIVILDEAQCTGCGACTEACPYDAIAFDEEHGIAQKCNLCHHRVDQGLVPACADNVCLAHCIHFGGRDQISRRPMGLRSNSRGFES